MKDDLSNFNRTSQLQQMENRSLWDLIVIGGGATGLGVAVDSASRGFKTLLLEQADFAKGTSSRSTKLVHGGVRYLAQGNIKLVRHALRERGLLLQNAPHLVRKQAFIIPCFSFFSKLKFLVGLKLYDWLSGTYSFGSSSFVSREEMLSALPRLNAKDVVGGIRYFDGQFDDARLALNLAQTCVEQGGTVVNYCRVTKLLKQNGTVAGVMAVDTETGKQYELQAKAVVNATGVFVDEIINMDHHGTRPMVRPSQGVHIVLDKRFLDSQNALMIPETPDGRVLFAIPWNNHVLVGTTDTPVNDSSLEPAPLKNEIAFVLQTVQQFMSLRPTEKDILSTFAGLRPLAAPRNENDPTREISRDHKLIVSKSGLITITGGKWTTYRQMAEETVNNAIRVGKLAQLPCKTEKLSIHGADAGVVETEYNVYGTDAAGIKKMIEHEPTLGKLLIDGFQHTEAEVVWAARFEMARTVEDVLARRMRLLFVDAKAALQAAPTVAAILGRELEMDIDWEHDQVEQFRQTAQHYLFSWIPAELEMKADFSAKFRSVNN
jgi:glycerol-3-phosphate dehydrogenase